MLTVRSLEIKNTENQNVNTKKITGQKDFYSEQIKEMLEQKALIN